MDKLQEQLDRMITDYGALKNTAEEQLSENMPIVERECSKAQVDYIKNALKSVREGNLDVSNLIKNFKKLNNAS